jgi:hypothetical protein
VTGGWLRPLRIGCYLVVIYFLAERLWSSRHGLGDSVRAVGPGRCAIAFALATAGLIPGMLGWRVLLAGLGPKLDLRTSSRLYFVGGLARYVPGGLWPALAHADTGRSLREPPATMVAGFLGSVVVATVAGFAVGHLAVPSLASRHPAWWLLAVALAAGVLPLVRPRLLTTLSTAVRRVLRRGGVPARLPDRRSLAVAAGLMAAGWLVSSLHVPVLADAFGATTVQSVAPLAGGYALAAVAGSLALILPAGIGAREVLLALTLGAYLSGVDLVATVALSRLVVTVADIAAAAVTLALTQRRR